MPQPNNGNAAEAAVLHAFVERDLNVLVPFGGGQPYDLVVDLGVGTFLRVQCKTAWPDGGCMRFNCRATDHGRGRVSYIGRADVFGVYFPPNSGVYLVPIDVVAGPEARLRVEPARNNQHRRVRLAPEFEIDRWTTESLVQLRIGAAGADAGARVSSVG